MQRWIATISAGFVLALAAGVTTANAGLHLPGQEAAPSLNEDGGAGQSGGGNVAEDSIGTLQVAGVSAEVEAEASSELLGTSADVDESLSSGGTGGNNATDSIGTAQLGGGNKAEDSIGTVQSGPISNDLSAEVTSEVLDTSADADAPLSIGGNGGNEADDSIGTAQLGGGNTAKDSIGTVQSGRISANPTLDASTDLLDIDLQAGAPLSVGSSGGNSASDSIGTVQLGGGNRASDSIGTVQSGPVSLRPWAKLDSDLLDADLDGPVQIGGNGGNVAEDSIGTVQIGGGNVAEDSIGTVQIGGGSGGGGNRPLSPPGQDPRQGSPGNENPTRPEPRTDDLGREPAAAGSAAKPGKPAAPAAPGRGASPATATGSSRAESPSTAAVAPVAATGSSLPFTGLSFLLQLLAAVTFLLSGLAVRRLGRDVRD